MEAKNKKQCPRVNKMKGCTGFCKNFASCKRKNKKPYYYPISKEFEKQIEAINNLLIPGKANELLGWG